MIRLLFNILLALLILLAFIYGGCAKAKTVIVEETNWELPKGSMDKLTAVGWKGWI